MASIRTAGLTKNRDGTEPAQDSRRRDPCAGVIAIARASGHHFSKPSDDIQLLAGLAVVGRCAQRPYRPAPVASRT
jgi:hypothetical protein